jgi:hypothetical protein
MTTLREAAEMALEALDCIYSPLHVREIDKVGKAMNALRAALEQPEQEPVAWMDREGDIYRMPEIKNWAPPHTLLYPAPPQRKWQGLTDEEIEDEWERITGHSIFGGNKADGRAMYLAPDEVTEFTRAIEAKLKEKNT